MRRRVRRRAKVYGPAGDAAFVVNTWDAFDNTERVILFIGSTLCGFACLWICSLLGIPRDPLFSGSLLAGGAPLTAMIAVGLSIGVCVLIGYVVATFIEPEAGLFCCCIGLASLGVRCGPMRPVLQYTRNAFVLPTLAFETVFLALALTGCWLLLQKVLAKLSATDASPDKTVAPNELSDPTLKDQLMTIGVQILVTALCEQILIQTDRQAQCMGGTLIAAFVGSLVAYMMTPLSSGIWYWSGPAVLGTVAYLLAFCTGDDISLGDLHGFTAPLARPTPLIYIGMGTAGALLGYWCSRRWAQPEEEVTEQTEPTTEPVAQTVP